MQRIGNTKIKIPYKNRYNVSTYRYGLLKELEGIEYNREQVRLRDNYTCQKCFKVWTKGRRFDVHHLLDIDGSCSNKYESAKVLLQEGYAITLCHKCHLSLPSEVEKIMRNRPKKKA
jgi:hypothetical protein